MIDEWWMMNDWWIMMHDEDDDESMMNVDERWINDKNMFGSWIMNDCMVESLQFFHGETRWNSEISGPSLSLHDYQVLEGRSR